MLQDNHSEKSGIEIITARVNSELFSPKMGSKSEIGIEIQKFRYNLHFMSAYYMHFIVSEIYKCHQEK